VKVPPSPPVSTEGLPEITTPAVTLPQVGDVELPPVVPEFPPLPVDVPQLPQVELPELPKLP
jgi:hypothetical protein